METKTAGYRSKEDRAGSPVRRFINTLSAGGDRPTRKMATRTACGMEQSELWPMGSDDAAPAPASMARAEAEPMEVIPFVDVKELPVTASRTNGRIAGRSSIHVPTVKNRMGAAMVQATSIARFLNVNGAIEGMKTGGIHFDLPGRGYLQALRLWKGSPETSNYSATL